MPVRLTYEDDITTVQQFQFMFRVIPELFHIKALELRGAYADRGSKPAQQVSAANEDAVRSERASK